MKMSEFNKYDVLTLDVPEGRKWLKEKLFNAICEVEKIAKKSKDENQRLKANRLLGQLSQIYSKILRDELEENAVRELQDAAGDDERLKKIVEELFGQGNQLV